MSFDAHKKILSYVVAFAAGVVVSPVAFPTHDAPMDMEAYAAKCVEALERSVNERRGDGEYGVSDYRYDIESGRCFYRGNFVADTLDGRYFEKFIVDAMSGETLAKYAEINGVPAASDLDGARTGETLEAFNAMADRLFQPAQ